MGKGVKTSVKETVRFKSSDLFFFHFLGKAKVHHQLQGRVEIPTLLVCSSGSLVSSVYEAPQFQVQVEFNCMIYYLFGRWGFKVGVQSGVGQFLTFVKNLWFRFWKKKKS
jgi:hypothetical protein